MSHQRANIRAAIVSALTGLPTTGANVLAGRAYPEDSTLLPALSVYTPEEEWNEDASEMVPNAVGEIMSVRNLSIAIVGMAIGGSYLDTLDQMALEIETALNADLFLGGECDALLYVGMEIEQMTDAMETSTGRITIAYRAEYQTDAKDPQSNLG